MGRTAREKALRWGTATAAALAMAVTMAPMSYAGTTDEPTPQRVGGAPKIPGERYARRTRRRGRRSTSAWSWSRATRRH